MRKALLPLAAQGIRRKKRSSWLIFSVLLISFAFAILSLSLVTSISRTNAEFLLNTYGAWYLGLPSGTVEDEAWLKEQPWADDVGTAMSFGQVITPGSRISCGTLDRSMKKVGRIRLDQGRWPEADGEIAIEAATLRMLGYEEELGQTIQLPLEFPLENCTLKGGGSYTVCGIIHSYTGLWFLDRNYDRRPLVGAVVTPEAAELMLEGLRIKLTTKDGVKLDPRSVDMGAIKPTPMYFISVDRKDRDTAFDALAEHMAALQSPEGSPRLPCDNTIAFPTIEEEQTTSLFTYMTAIVSLAALLCAYIMQLPAEIQSFATFRSIGITKPQLAALLLTESVLLALPAMVLGIPLGAGLTWAALRLLMYSGSVPIQVYVPYAQLLPLAGLWLLMVLASRSAVFLAAVRTPLVGRFQLDAAKARRHRRFRSALISLLTTVLITTIIFTTLSSMAPVRLRHAFDEEVSDYDLHTHWHHGSYPGEFASSGPDDLTGILTEEDVRLICQIPGITGAYGFSCVPVTLSFPGFLEEVTMYAVDERAWEREFSLGRRQADFHDGEFCLLCIPKGHETDFLLPENTVTLHIIDYLGEELTASPPTDVSIFQMPQEFGLKVYQLWEPYTMVCSHAYLKRLVDSMEPGTHWNDFVSGGRYFYQNVHVNADMSAADLSTDVAMTKYCGRKLVPEANVSMNIDRETNMAVLQRWTQRLIFLCAGGGSIIAMVLLILISAIALETEQEKRRYGTLRVLGMSLRQMRLDIWGRGLGRGALALASGWLIYDLLAIAPYLADGESLEEAAAHVLSVLSYEGFSWGHGLLLSLICVLVVLTVCLLGKRKLMKEARRR